MKNHKFCAINERSECEKLKKKNVENGRVTLVFEKSAGRLN